MIVTETNVRACGMAAAWAVCGVGLSVRVMLPALG